LIVFHNSLSMFLRKKKYFFTFCFLSLFTQNYESSSLLTFRLRLLLSLLFTTSKSFFKFSNRWPLCTVCGLSRAACLWLDHLCHILASLISDWIVGGVKKERKKRDHHHSPTWNIESSGAGSTEIKMKEKAINLFF